MVAFHRLILATALSMSTISTGCAQDTASATQAPDKIAQAVQQIRAGNLPAAEKLLREVVSEDEEQTRGWYLLGYTLHAQKKFDDALAAHLRATADENFAGPASYNAACVYALRGDKDEAIKMLRAAIAAGAGGRTQLLSDQELNSLRSDPRFAELIPPPIPEDELFAEPAEILHSFYGETAGDEFGWVARRIGDIDDDGAIDFVATAPSFGNGSGKIYVYSSRSGELRFAHTGQNGERLGNGAAGAGDINGDGTPDVIVGAPRNGPDSQAGKAYVYSGKDGQQLLELAGENAGDRFGYKVCGLGDINGDDCADVAVSAMVGDGSVKDCGSVSIFSGKTGDLLFKLTGENSGDKFGSALAGSEDSQWLRLAVGAQDAGPNAAGKVYVYDLGGDEPKRSFTIDPDEGNVDLGQMFVAFPGDLDGDGVGDVYASDFSDRGNLPSTGSVRVHSGADGSLIHKIYGSAPQEGFGTSPSDAGDVDGDGRGDLVIGAWQNAEQAPSGGKIYLYSGATAKLMRTWTCRESGDTLGFDSVGIGDVNDDGRIDFLVTSAWSSAKHPKGGRVFILSGKTVE